MKHNGRAVVRQLALRLRVDAHQLQILPHLLQQVVKVPLVVGGDGDAVRNLVDHVQLLDTNLIDLIEQVDARDVDPVALDYVDQLQREYDEPFLKPGPFSTYTQDTYIVRVGVIAQSYVRIVDLVLAQDGLDRV